MLPGILPTFPPIISAFGLPALLPELLLSVLVIESLDYAERMNLAGFSCRLRHPKLHWTLAHRVGRLPLNRLRTANRLGPAGTLFFNYLRVVRGRQNSAGIATKPIVSTAGGENTLSPLAGSRSYCNQQTVSVRTVSNRTHFWAIITRI